MSIEEAYNKYRDKAISDISKYNTIVSGTDSMLLATIYLLKHYKDYILLFEKSGKQPRITNLSILNIKEKTALHQLLKACVLATDSFMLDPSKILIKEEVAKDPMNLLDIVLQDYIKYELTPDTEYETIIRSIYNLIIPGDVERLLKNVFLMFTNSKDY